MEFDNYISIQSTIILHVNKNLELSIFCLLVKSIKFLVNKHEKDYDSNIFQLHLHFELSKIILQTHKLIVT